MSIDRETSLRIQRRGLADFIRLLGSSSPDAGLFETDGVIGAVVPACPDRSIVNSISYEDVAGLEAALGEMGDAYLDAGVRCRLVWVPDFDEEAAAILEAAGYLFDGAPAAMHADLAAIPQADIGDLDWDCEATPEEVGRINDSAYGLPPKEGIGRSFTSPNPDMPLRLYRARVDGESACVVGTLDQGDDLGIYLVATLRDHRGLGLTSRLMRAAFAEARERDLRTTSLQASAMGEPIYLKLGYETTFRLKLFEHREKE